MLNSTETDRFDPLFPSNRERLNIIENELAFLDDEILRLSLLIRHTSDDELSVRKKQFAKKNIKSLHIQRALNTAESMALLGRDVELMLDDIISTLLENNADLPVDEEWLISRLTHIIEIANFS